MIIYDKVHIPTHGGNQIRIRIRIRDHIRIVGHHASVTESRHRHWRPLVQLVGIRNICYSNPRRQSDYPPTPAGHACVTESRIEDRWVYQDRWYFNPR